MAWGEQKPAVIKLGYEFSPFHTSFTNYCFGNFVSCHFIIGNFFCIGIHNQSVHSVPSSGADTYNHLLYAERTFITGCHKPTLAQPCCALETEVNESCISPLCKFDRRDLQEAIDRCEYVTQQRRWVPLERSCFFCRLSFQLRRNDDDTADLALQKKCNSFVTYIQDIVFINPIASLGDIDNIKSNSNYIPDEISLHHVRQDGTLMEGDDRPKTHRLHSIVYSDGSHFISRFLHKGHFFHYDGMKMNCNIRQDRVKCIRLAEKTVSYNPLSYYIPNGYHASVIIYVKINILLP